MNIVNIFFYLSVLGLVSILLWLIGLVSVTVRSKLLFFIKNKTSRLMLTLIYFLTIPLLSYIIIKFSCSNHIEKITKMVVLNSTKANRIIKDVNTNLIWQDNDLIIKKKWTTDTNFKAKNYMNTDGDTATTYCKKLNLAGYTDWRLPTYKELSNLYGKRKKLKNITENNYWSSTTDTAYKHSAITKGFSKSDFLEMGSALKNEYNYVICVRNEKF